MLNWGLLGGALGIYVCYSLYGLAQEEIMTTKFGTEQEMFKETTFLLLFQTLCNALFAYLTLLFTREPPMSTSMFAFAPPAFFYIAAMYTSNVALQYIDYPTQVLGKSCKPLSVLLVGTVMTRSLLPTAKYVSVVLISAGIVLFSLQKVKKGGVDEMSDTQLLYGRALIFVSLLSDGLTGALQDALVGSKRPSAYHLMLWNNLWAAAYLAVVAAFSSGVMKGVAFASRHPSLVPMMVSFALTSAAGQMFIYYTVRHHGSLVCTMLTTTRKFFTILLSVFWFGHELSRTQWTAVAVVFVGIALDDSFSAKKKHAAPTGAHKPDSSAVQQQHEPRKSD